VHPGQRNPEVGPGFTRARNADAKSIVRSGAALERQESAPEVHAAMTMFPEALAAPPDRTIYDASRDPSLI